MKKTVLQLPAALTANDRRRLWLALTTILLLCLPLLFFHLGSWSFFDPDEGRYGSIPREMLLSGNFITPTQNHLKFFDKPPLLYWTIAASYTLFGFQEWAARLATALAALLGVFAAYALGRRMFGPRAGLLSAVILATSLMWPIMARIVMTDILFSSLLFVAFVFWWLEHTAPDARQRATYAAGLALALALAILAKGPVTLVLMGGTLLLYALLCRQWRALGQTRWGIVAPLGFAIAAPWFFLVAAQNPEFNHFFWYDQHIARFLGRTTGNDHVEGIGYYFQFLPLIFFPWSLFAPAALLAGWKNWRSGSSEKRRALAYLLCGGGLILLFFSASSGKILTYILPVVPLLAVLMAAYFDWLYERRGQIAGQIAWSRVLTAGVVVLALLLAAGGVAIVLGTPRKLQSLGADAGLAVMAGTILLVWAVALMLLTWRFHLNGLIAATAGGFTATFVGAQLVVISIAPQLTTEILVDYIRPGLTPRAKIVTIDYPQSVGFYTGKRVDIIDPPDEVSLGMRQLPPRERRRWIFDGADHAAELRRDLDSSAPVYCFVRNTKRKHKVEKMLRKLGEDAVKIVANERYLIIGNRAAAALTPPHPDV